MQSILFSILLSILNLTPQQSRLQGEFMSTLTRVKSHEQFTQKKIDVDFQFNEMRPGKPTLAMYYYDITIKNNEDRSWYIAIPCWFKGKIERSDEVSGAQYDTFGEIEGITLFTNNTFTIFQVQPGQKMVIHDFCIKTFDEKIRGKSTIKFNYAVFNNISVGEKSLSDFMNDQSLHHNELPYLLSEAYDEEVNIKVKK